MKKLIVGLLAAFLMTTGLVGFSATTASAACPKYTGCFNTVTNSSVKVARNGKATIKVTVKAKGSSARPVGKVTVTVKGPKKYSSTKAYAGGTKSFVTGKLKKGKYTYVVKFVKKADSVFNSSTDKGSFRVK